MNKSIFSRLATWIACILTISHSLNLVYRFNLPHCFSLAYNLTQYRKSRLWKWISEYALFNSDMSAYLRYCFMYRTYPIHIVFSFMSVQIEKTKNCFIINSWEKVSFLTIRIRNFFLQAPFAFLESRTNSYGDSSNSHKKWLKLATPRCSYRTP